MLCYLEGSRNIWLEKLTDIESGSFAAMKNSVKANRLQAVKGERTIADGIAVKMPGKNTFKIINELIDDIVTVDDTQIVKTMFLLMERAKSVVEIGRAHV